MFEPIIAPIAFALLMLAIALFAVTRAVRRRMTGRSSESDPTNSEVERTHTRRAG